MVWLVALADTSPKLLSAAKATCGAVGWWWVRAVRHAAADAGPAARPTGTAHPMHLLHLRPHSTAGPRRRPPPSGQPGRASRGPHPAHLEDRLGGAARHPGQALDGVGHRADGQEVVGQQEGADLQAESKRGMGGRAVGGAQPGPASLAAVRPSPHSHGTSMRRPAPPAAMRAQLGAQAAHAHPMARFSLAEASRYQAREDTSKLWAMALPNSSVPAWPSPAWGAGWAAARGRAGGSNQWRRRTHGWAPCLLASRAPAPAPGLLCAAAA